MADIPGATGRDISEEARRKLEESLKGASKLDQMLVVIIQDGEIVEIETGECPPAIRAAMDLQTRPYRRSVIRSFEF